MSSNLVYTDVDSKKPSLAAMGASVLKHVSWQRLKSANDIVNGVAKFFSSIYQRNYYGKGFSPNVQPSLFGNPFEALKMPFTSTDLCMNQRAGQFEFRFQQSQQLNPPLNCNLFPIRIFSLFLYNLLEIKTCVLGSRIGHIAA